MKRINKYWLWFILLSLPCFIFTDCKKDCYDEINPECVNYQPCEDPTDPNCDNYDPCHGVKEITANFKMLEIPPSYYLVAPSVFIQNNVDTSMYDQVKFEGPKGMNSYTWLIGAEVLHDRVVGRYKLPVGVKIPITLIVEGTPNKDCFPNDDGRDTLIRELYISDQYCDDVLTQGYFLGYHNDDITDTSTVNIRICEQYPTNNYDRLPYIMGLFPCGKYILAGEAVYSQRQLAFSSAGEINSLNCKVPYGRIEMRGDSIFAQYRFRDGDAPEKWHYFRGKRTQ